MKRLFVILAAVSALAGCSSSGSGSTHKSNPPRAATTQASRPVIITAPPPPPLTSVDRPYLKVARSLAQGESSTKLVKFGHIVCDDFFALGAKATLANAQRRIPDFTAREIYELVSAASTSYCSSELTTLRRYKPAPPKPPKPQRLTFEVYGNGSESGVITYSEGTDIEQASDASLPWKKPIAPSGDFYQLSAQDGDGTSITCEIIDTDGTVLGKKTSTGPYAIASCSTDG